MTAGGAFRGNSGLIATLVGCAAFMQAFDASAVVIALPAMAREFAVEPLALNLTVMAYTIGATCVLPVGGWAADRLGARLLFLIAVGLFGLSAALCGLARDATELIIARTVEGAAGALLLPVGRIIVLNIAPRDQFVSAMAMLTAPVLLGPILGPVLGGFIVTYASWRWIFFLQAPCALISLLLMARVLPRIRPQAARPFDGRGWTLLSLCLLFFTCGVGLAGRPSAAMWQAVVLAAAGIAYGIIYCRHDARHPHPIVDMAVLRLPTVKASNIGGLLPRMLVSASPFLLTMQFQIGFGLSAVDAGGLLFAVALGSLSGRWFLVPLIRRYGFTPVLNYSACAVAASVAWCGLFTATTPHAVILLALFVHGLLRTFFLTAIMTLGYADLDDTHFATASTLSSLSQQLAISGGIAISVFAIQASQAWHGTTTMSGEVMRPAFLLLALSPIAALHWFRRLPADVGASLTRSTPQAKAAEGSSPDG